MVCPRRSDPLPAKRSTPSSAPCGIVGRLTASSVDFGPLGAFETNQISQTGALPATLVPSFCKVAEMDPGKSDGGGPAGSTLYCEKAAPAAMIRINSGFSICTYHYRRVGIRT